MAADAQQDERLLLVAPDSRLRRQLDAAGLRVITWPKLQVQAPQSFVSLDEAIESLYGYDWIVFINPDSVHFFLERLAHKGQEVSDVDSLRVYAIGEATATGLDQSRVHVDIVTAETDPSEVMKKLKLYVGVPDALNRLNFLIPQAAIGRAYLESQLADVGARADVISAYQTVATEELTRLAGLQSMLLTGSIDAVLFASPDEVREFARVFEINDLRVLLGNTKVLTTDDHTTREASSFGLSHSVQASDSSANAVAVLVMK